MAKRGLSRKELEDLKKREETEAAASVCVYTIIHLPHIIHSFCGFQRYLKNLWQHFKKIAVKSQKFGSRLVHMMLDKKVYAYFNHVLRFIIYLLLLLLQKKTQKIKENCTNQCQRWQQLNLLQESQSYWKQKNLKIKICY